MQKLPKGLPVIILLGLLGLLFLAPWIAPAPMPARSYSEFVQDLRDGAVTRVVMNGSVLTADYTSGESMQVQLPAGDRTMTDLLMNESVSVEFAQQSGRSVWGLLLSILVPVAMIGGAIWFMSSQGSGGTGQVFQFGQSRARLHTAGDRTVTMRDVAGLPEAKEELWEVVDFLRSPERYQELGARIPKGVLLYGPPGTGKTLLARAVAGEAGVPFYSISGSDFVEMFAGVGASRVRDLFSKARSHAPCIIFVDEIDAVGRHRGVSLSSGNDEREQTLNQLLVEMDGFATAEGLIVMAATNRLDILDPAILRPGRFDRQIGVDPPDKQGRKEILAVHAAGKPLEADVDLEQIAAMTTGFTGAELANLLNEAALLAARRRRPDISTEELRMAYERIVAGGPALRRQMAPKEKLRVAFHEAGHAVVSRLLTHSDPIEKVTIVPRGKALGYVMYRPKEDKNLHTRAEIMDRIVGLFGGRAAEEVLLDEVSSGAADDLERATTLARRMVTELGMHPEIGPVNMKMEQEAYYGMVGTKAVSNRTATVIDEAVRQVLLEAYDRAADLVRSNRESLEKVARALMEHESLDRKQLDDILAV